MYIIKPFFPTVFTLWILLFVPNAMAYIKFTLETPPLDWQSEEMVYEDSSVYSDFFINQKVQLEATVIIPDLEHIDWDYKEFHDPVLSVKTSNLYESITVNNSWFAIEIMRISNDEIYKLWYLTFDITDQDNPHPGATRRGFFQASGGFNDDLSGGGWASLDFYQDNWIYYRQSTFWELDIAANFQTERVQLTGEKISVPEPGAPALLMSALLFIGIVRWKYKVKLFFHLTMP